MNFLEQLVAEWYEFRGYLVQTNVRFGRNPKARGGWEGEMDVVAFHPVKKILVHVEVSMDTISWKSRGERFRDKFEKAERYYPSLFKFEFERVEKKIVLAYASRNPGNKLPMEGVEVKSVYDLLEQIKETLRREKYANPDGPGLLIPEKWPLLRAIQWAFFWKPGKPG
jgi:hypothetical protein